MELLWTALFLLLAVGTLVGAFLDDAGVFEDWRSRSGDVSRELEETDQANAREYRQARQAMNRAAGQEWRNLLDP